MANRKTLPLNNVLNRVVAKAKANRMTADNVRRDADQFSSLTAAERIACEWEASARELELLAIEIMQWQRNADINTHIFHFHREPQEVERPMHDRLEQEYLMLEANPIFKR